MIIVSQFNIIVLSPDEQVLSFLNPDIVDIEEKRSIDNIRSISLKMPITENNKEYKNLFRMGNKIYIAESEVSSSCLYVINTNYKLNYWADNTIEVEAEEVIVELNNVEPFFYVGNPITVVPVSENEDIRRSQLNSWFGKYYNIGTVEYPTSDILSTVEPVGSMTLMELMKFIEEETGNLFCQWYVPTRRGNKTYIARFLDFLQPQHLGSTHSSVLDIGYNTDNIEYEVNESDTYKAIAPLFSVNEDSTASTNTSTSQNSASRDDIAILIEEWRDFEVKKGETIPKVCEKYTESSTSDGTTQNQEEKIRYTSYWDAPFSKNKGEMFVFDDTDTGVEYGNIISRPDSENLQISPKCGTVTCNETDLYAVYNICAEELIEKRYPEITVDVDAYNLKEILSEGQFNLWDKIYMKIPNFDVFLLGRITETTKNPHKPGEDKITLSNCSEIGKLNQKETFFVISDLTVVEGAGTCFKGKLYTRYDNSLGTVTVEPLADKLVSITVIYEGEQNNSSSNNSSSTSDSSNNTGYSKCGVSSDNKTIMAIGRPSAAGELSQYGYKFYKTIFENKCPFCGGTNLVWGIFWAGNETSNWGTFECNGKQEGGSAEGHIFCKNCDADFSCIDGKDHQSPPRQQLTRVSGPESSTKEEAYKLKNGEYATSSNTTSNSVIGESVDSIMREAATIEYSASGCSASCENVDEGYECVKKSRKADCFGMSAYLYRRLVDNGHQTRIISYYSPYSSSGTHRSVQIYQNNSWVDPSYSGFDTLFKAMTTKKDMTVCKESGEIANSGSSTSTGAAAYKKTYTKRTDDSGEFGLQINLRSEEYKLQCDFGGDTEYASISNTVKLVVAPPGSTNISNTVPSGGVTSGGSVCSRLSELTGVTINSIDSLYSAFTKTKYRLYYNEEVDQEGAFTRISKGQGLNCVDSNQIAYYALKELGVEVRILNGTVHCASDWGHIWCEIKDSNNSWTVFDASAAAKGKKRGSYICGSSATISNVNPAWLLSDDGIT